MHHVFGRAGKPDGNLGRALTMDRHVLARRCDIHHSWLDRITRPTLLISAADDPFLPSTYWPREAVVRSPWLEAEFSERGGHVGFVEGSWPWAASYWVDRRAVAFLDTIRCKEGW